MQCKWSISIFIGIVLRMMRVSGKHIRSVIRWFVYNVQCLLSSSQFVWSSSSSLFMQLFSFIRFSHFPHECPLVYSVISTHHALAHTHVTATVSTHSHPCTHIYKLNQNASRLTVDIYFHTIFRHYLVIKSYTARINIHGFALFVSVNSMKIKIPTPSKRWLQRRMWTCMQSNHNTAMATISSRIVVNISTPQHNHTLFAEWVNERERVR